MKLAELTTAQTDEIVQALDMAVNELLVNHADLIKSYEDATWNKPLIEVLKTFEEIVDLDGDLYDLPDSKDFAGEVHHYLNPHFVRFEDNDRAQDLLDYARRYNALFA